MLKLQISIQCDECKEQFQFVRTSPFTTDALSFNTNALTAMLPSYHWETHTTDENRFHFCPECYYKFLGFEPEEAAVPLTDESLPF